MDETTYSIVEKVNGIKESLNSNFLERKNAVDMIILSVISKKHSILIGGPGLAKTAVLKALAYRVKGLRFFDFQMTPATKIEELISNRPQNKTGIDNCDIALIDEFFKGSHSTLNSLLSIMNERIIYSPEPRRIPLISLFAASNERPDKSSDSNLLPLYDRFLFRMEILAVKDGKNFKRLLELKEKDDSNGNNSGETLLSKEDIEILSSEAETVEIGGEIFDCLYKIREELKNKQVTVSDRRWRETVKILKTNAVLNRRSYVVKEDIRMLEPSLWTYYSDIRAVKNILGRELK
ncbi:MAG: MoxR family ATPase [Deltaproteobacteria bacterium]|nr:MoxR family ATPase [Deltaproteobacteria bacterium]